MPLSASSFWRETVLSCMIGAGDVIIPEDTRSDMRLTIPPAVR